MFLTENKYSNISGTFPNALMIDASGAGLTDGSEFAALPLNDGWEPFSQAVMSYAAGVQLQNSPTGSVGVPNGVADSVGLSQMLQALQQSIGNGPGNYTLWGNDSDPSVTGDRIVLLAEQGLLIAVYPGIDDANWIGGNTAAQIAAEAAGQKFYRSSDAAGLLGDAAGPYIQLPPQPSPTFLKQYTEGGGYFTATGTNWTTVRASAVPYQTIDGAWRLIYNISGTLSIAANTVDVTISGITSKNTVQAAIAAKGAALSQFAYSRILASTNKIITKYADALTVTDFSFYGDIELTSKPTWADDFEYKWGIRY